MVVCEGLGGGWADVDEVRLAVVVELATVVVAVGAALVLVLGGASDDDEGDRGAALDWLASGVDEESFVDG